MPFADVLFGKQGRRKRETQLLKRWHTAPSGGSKRALASARTVESRHEKRHAGDAGRNVTNKRFAVTVCNKKSEKRENCERGVVTLDCPCHGSYLGVVLKHLIALHVVTLEHDDRPVEAGHVQAEVVRPDFFVRCVRKDLVKRDVKKKTSVRAEMEAISEEKREFLSFYYHLFCFIYEMLWETTQGVFYIFIWFHRIVMLCAIKAL